MTLGNEGLSIFGIPPLENAILAFQGHMGIAHYVDGTLGSDNNSGSSWAKAKETIQAALDLCAARGYHSVFVRSGAYQETLTTPVNATAPFCQLIGVEARDTGSGCYLYAVSTTTNILTINARGWRISGFEFESGSAAAGVKLTRDTAGTPNRADYTQIDNCSFVTGKYGIESTGSPYEVVIRNNTFFNIATTAIVCTNSDFANPRKWTIRDNDFSENTSHIILPMNAGFVYGNIMQGTGGARSAKSTSVINLVGGTQGCNTVGGNWLGIAGGTGSGGYDETSGCCQAGTNDFWCGNYSQGGCEDKNPAGGS